MVILNQHVGWHLAVGEDLALHGARQMTEATVHLVGLSLEDGERLIVAMVKADPDAIRLYGMLAGRDAVFVLERV